MPSLSLESFLATKRLQGNWGKTKEHEGSPVSPKVLPHPGSWAASDYSRHLSSPLNAECLEDRGVLFFLCILSAWWVTGVQYLHNETFFKNCMQNTGKTSKQRKKAPCPSPRDNHHLWSFLYDPCTCATTDLHLILWNKLELYCV